MATGANVHLLADYTPWPVWYYLMPSLDLLGDFFWTVLPEVKKFNIWPIWKCYPSEVCTMTFFVGKNALLGKIYSNCTMILRNPYQHI